ncbi:hypothetical protein EUA67_00405 [TM7 phylum sp. oral taxon 352]|nr:hypothetical protein EUA67_00405 [TM7 phylum sp. oral taxon 352]
MTGNRTQDEFLFLFLEEIGKRNEISSRVLKNNTLSRTRDDEKKDGAMNFLKALFGKMGIFGKSGPELDYLIYRIKEAEAKLLEADSHLESSEHAFYRSVSMFSEYSESSYSEVMVYWDRYQDAEIEWRKALEELSKQLEAFRQASGRRYKTQVYKKMYTSVYDIRFSIF